MPRILPALLAGVFVGMVIGPIACVVVARHTSLASVDASASVAEAVTVTIEVAETPASASGAAPGDHRPEPSAEAEEGFSPPATVEYFALDRLASGDLEAAGSRANKSIAVIAIRRLEGPNSVLLEREIVFEEDGVRVLHTERIEGATRRLVWREFLPSGARSWMAEWRTDGERVRTIGYGWHRNIHERIEGQIGMVGPLELLEGLRRSSDLGPGAAETTFSMVDPTAATVTEVVARTVACVAGTECTVEVRRPDESLVLEAVIAQVVAGGGTAGILKRLRFGEGRIVATPIRKNEFHRRRARWAIVRVPAHESILARIPKRH